MRNSSDPPDLLALASGAARLWLRTSIRTQELLLGLLQGNGEEIPPPARSVPDTVETESVPPTDSLGSKMRNLLDRALDQDTTGSQGELYNHILDQLVADEARIIGALSDGSASPLVNVYDWTRRRTPGRAVLENASLIGRTANVALPEMVPAYLSHLLSLGLVEIGPEDPDLKDDYEVLLAETPVLGAIKEASRGPLTPKVDKLTLSLSNLGHALWTATMRENEP